MSKYQVWTLDVWGNEDDGWEVNDRWPAGTVEGKDDKAIVESLVRHGYLKAGTTTKDVEIDDSDEDILFVEDSDTDEPLLQLEKISENPIAALSLGGMTTAETIGVAVGGAAILGLIGYGIYKLVQGPQAPASYMGPGGSTTPLGPAANPAARAAGYIQQPTDYPTGDPNSDQTPPFVPGVQPPGAQDA